MPAPLLAYNIRRLVDNPDYWRDELDDGLEAAPTYERFGVAAPQVIRAIHAIPKLWDDVGLGRVEVYVGRAGATAAHVRGRWKSHRREKGHQHGVVVLCCSTDIVQVWEKAALRVLKRLRDADRLCVKNASTASSGAEPNEEMSCIYLTWKLSREIILEPSDRRFIDEVARGVASDMRDNEIRLDQMRRALDPLSRPQRACATMDWHPMHEEDR